jgi:large conductance mechanosensitive channel
VKDFKEFLLRGNLVDTAVGIVIGVAFAALIAAFVADLITPLLAAIGGNPNFDSLSFTINGSHFLYGHFLNAVFTFLIIAAVIFFLVVKPVNALMERRRTEPAVDEPTRQCPRPRGAARSARRRLLPPRRPHCGSMTRPPGSCRSCRLRPGRSGCTSAALPSTSESTSGTRGRSSSRSG